MGLSVMSRQRAISKRSFAGVRWVSPVMIPRPAGIRDSRGQFGEANIMHAALE